MIVYEKLPTGVRVRVRRLVWRVGLCCRPLVGPVARWVNRGRTRRAIAVNRANAEQRRRAAAVVWELEKEKVG